MAELLEDDMGRIKPQYEKLDGSGYEAWKGKDGHGNVRSDDGQIVALGSTGDADTANTVIGRLKKILAILPTAHELHSCQDRISYGCSQLVYESRVLKWDHSLFFVPLPYHRKSGLFYDGTPGKIGDLL
jgi:hypothetical protein